MITPVLVLHGKLSVAISLKQALERDTRFEVHPFTTPDASVDYLHEHPQDVVLVDLSSLRDSAESVVGWLRQAQPDILVIVSPPPSEATVSSLGINAVLNANYRPKDVVSAIETVMRGVEPPSTTAQKSGITGMLEHIFDDPPPPPPMPETLPEHGSLEDVLHQMGHGDFGFADDDTGATPRDPQSHGAEFNELLDSLSPNDDRRRGRSNFDDLVDSLRRDQPPPSRSRMTDFIIRGGIDSLLNDIDNAPPPDRFRSVTGKNYTDDAMRNYQNLAREEPPMPDVLGGGTVSELVTGVNDKGFQKVLSILRGDEVDESSDIVHAEDSDFEYSSGVIDVLSRPDDPGFDFDDVPSVEASPAHIILEQTVGDFSLDELLDNIERQIPGNVNLPMIRPMPAHVREDAERRWRAALQAERATNAPFMRPAKFDEAFESDIPPDMPPDVPEGFFSDQTTRPSRVQKYETKPELMDTEWLDSPLGVAKDTLALIKSFDQPAPPPATPTPAAPPPKPPESLPEKIAEAKEPPKPPIIPGIPEAAPAGTSVEKGDSAEWTEWTDLQTADFNTQFELMAAFEVENAEGEQSTGALYTEVPVDVPPPQIDRAAQLALQLTDFSLETTAEAVVLVRDGEIVGRAGRMSVEELASLEPVIVAAWNAGRRDARVQFVNQQDTGRDYLLYACRTEEDFLLSLIFKGSTSMGDIRRQGNRLVKALTSVPEDLPVPVAPPPAPAVVDPGPREPFAYVWLLRDPNSYIDNPVAQAITAGMQMQLQEASWRIHELHVSEDYIYVYAEVPGEEPAFRTIRDLKRRSAEIARAQNGSIQPDNLWADSYLIVTPGRNLDIEEIQQFINFERM